MKSGNRTNWVIVCLWAGFSAVASCGQGNSSQLTWLEGKVHPATGLVNGFDDGKDDAPLYANAVASIVFSHAGRFDLAAGIFEALESVYTNSRIEGMSQGSGGLLYDQRPGSQPLSGHGDFRTGENAWLIMAINYYQSVSGDQRFAAFGTNLLEAVSNYRNNDTNSISYGAFRWNSINPEYSTEFQIDIYAALQGRRVLSGNSQYLEHAADLRAYLLDDPGYPLVEGNTKVWLALTDPVFCGTTYYTNAPVYLDGQAWGVLALYPPVGDEVDFTQVLPSIDQGGDWEQLGETVICGGLSVTGFSDEFLPGGVDTNWVWLEGTEFVSAAYLLIGNSNRSDYYHQQVAQLVRTNGSLYHSCANDGSVTTNRWPDNYQVGSVDATSWFYFVENGVNPFVPPPARPTFNTVRRISEDWVSTTFSSVPGTNYTLWTTTNLGSGQWTRADYATNLFGDLLSEPLKALRPATTVFFPTTNESREFFRVERE